MSEGGKNERDIESLRSMTVEEKLKKANIPLLAQVLDVASNTLFNDVNRRTLVDPVFNIDLTDHEANSISVSVEEASEIETACRQGEGYQPKTWLYGHFLKTSDMADFNKYGMSESLNYSLSNGSTTPYPRHMALGDYVIKHPMFGYITMAESSHIRTVDRVEEEERKSQLARSRPIGASLSMTNLNTGTDTAFQNNIMIHAISGKDFPEVKEINLDTLEKVHRYMDCMPVTQEKPTLAVVFGEVRTDINTVFEMSNIEELVKGEFEDGKWIDWTFQRLYPILKKCLNLMNKAADVNTIKSSVDKVRLTSTTENWNNYQTFMNYKKQVFAVLKNHDVMGRDNDQMTAALKPSEQTFLANALYDNLPQKTEMEKAFKNVVKAGSEHAKGKFVTIPTYFRTATQVFTERMGVSNGAMKFAIPLVGVVQNHDDRVGNKNNKRPVDDGDDDILANLNPAGTKTAATRCDGCGYIGNCSDKKSCVYKDHPGYNAERVSWADSTNGKAYADPAIMPAKPGASVATGCRHLVFTHKPDGSALTTQEMAGLKRHFTPLVSPLNRKGVGGKHPRR